jgi:heme exporter protein B
MTAHPQSSSKPTPKPKPKPPPALTMRPTRTAYFKKVLAIAGKDVAAELRTKEMLGSMFVFSLLVIFVFNFAFDLRAQNLNTLTPGVLWATITFAGVLGLSRSFIVEQDRGSLEGLLLAPVDRSALYFGKLIGNVLFIASAEVMILPFFVILFNLPLNVLPPIVGIIMLGTIGFASVGTLFSAMVVQTRSRDVLLPILLFPVVIPVLLASVRLTAGVLDGVAFSDTNHWLALLVAFDVIFIAVSFMLFEYVVEE